jgi:hypothetical protein
MDNMGVFLDLLPNQPKNDQSRENFRQMLEDKFREKIPDAVERIWDLPPIILKKPNENYLALLLEARELFLLGYFYSCVAMCGVVGERLVKDLFRSSILVEKNGQVRRPDEVAFNQFEHIEVSGIVRFLGNAELLSNEAIKAAVKLGELRNRYAHARGQDPQKDALDAIRLLHALVEDTVSVFKDFEIRNGAFMRKVESSNIKNETS